MEDFDEWILCAFFEMRSLFWIQYD